GNGETVASTNTRVTGGLTISKHAVGDSGTFHFDVDCDGTAYDHLGANAITLQVAAGATESTLIDGIPTGTSCTVTEQANGLFSTVVVPANGTVTIDTNGETVAFTNNRNFGVITVTKVLSGAANGATTSFTF